jgi:hypothetical protein
MNKAICNRTDERFTKGKEYNCTETFAKYETAMIGVYDNQGDIIEVDLNDKDFKFIIGA